MTTLPVPVNFCVECKTTTWQPCEYCYIAFSFTAIHTKNLYEAYTQPYEYATLRLHLSNVTYKESENKCQFSHGHNDFDDDDNNNNILGTSHTIRKVLQCET